MDCLGAVQYASERKVMLTGPFGFTALLRLVLQAHKNFHYEKELQEIVGLIEQFQRQYEKFGDSLAKVGRYREAVHWYQRTMTIDPGHRLALENLRAIQTWMAERNRQGG
jgi:DNA anti-recombination protein RmuC